MQPASSIRETASRVLEQHCVQISAAGPWRWRCGLQNGSLHPMQASLGDGFLHLASWPHPWIVTAPLLERALRANRSLRGGVRFALDASSRNLHMRADLPIFDEVQLAAALQSAAVGFHEGLTAMDAGDAQIEPALPASSGSSSVDFANVLSDVTWRYSQRSANEFSVELDAEAAPSATLFWHDGRAEAGVELMRSTGVSGAHPALATFLLTANSALCFCQAYSQPAPDQEIYRLRSCLSASPAPEEVENALAALSVGYRLCAREAGLLLTETAAQAYLSARNLNAHSSSTDLKED